MARNKVSLSIIFCLNEMLPFKATFQSHSVAHHWISIMTLILAELLPSVSSSAHRSNLYSTFVSISDAIPCASYRCHLLIGGLGSFAKHRQSKEQSTTKWSMFLDSWCCFQLFFKDGSLQPQFFPHNGFAGATNQMHQFDPWYLVVTLKQHSEVTYQLRNQTFYEVLFMGPAPWSLSDWWSEETNFVSKARLVTTEGFPFPT